jgi:hypothetical protein
LIAGIGRGDDIGEACAIFFGASRVARPMIWTISVSLDPSHGPKPFEKTFSDPCDALQNSLNALLHILNTPQ